MTTVVTYGLECYSATEDMGCALVPPRSMGSLFFVARILFSRHQEMGENMEDTFLSSILPAIDHSLAGFLDIS